MKIISADERLAERRGVKSLVIGPDRCRQDLVVNPTFSTGEV
jgi:hypothetical protein